MPAKEFLTSYWEKHCYIAKESKVVIWDGGHTSSFLLSYDVKFQNSTKYRLNL